ncbi:MAG TPA: TlpA disulfide reductase family protein [Candidatus Sulfotelmatobacter sp.]|nr:TlpA disulfide reductase family protein [Candidatus Sulfotelmatobacter sp.]
MKGIYGLIFIAILYMLADQVAAASDLPRYKFAPDEELVYSGSSGFDFGNGTVKYSDTTRFWVTGQNPDGSWHLIFIGQNKEILTGDYAPAHGIITNATISFGHMNLLADGRRVDKPATLLTAIYPAFFPLPADANQARSGWSFAKSFDVEATNHVTQTDPWIIESIERGIAYDIKQIGASNTIYFNDELGLVEKIQVEKQRAKWFGAGTVELESHAVRNRDWMHQFISDADAVDQAEAATEAAYKSVETGAAEPEIARAAAQQVLESALAHVQYGLLRDKLNSDLGNLDEQFRVARDEREGVDLVLNKPSPAWATTDLDGQKHALEDYRGKVVALDFWERDCAPCMVAMPQIKALADQFRGQPVVFLGMNGDRRDEDARFVVNKMQLNFLTLHGADIVEKYGVDDFPTFIVIDQKGIVRVRHEGCQPTLREDMAESISNLLSGNP